MNICGKSATKIFTAKDFRTWSGTLLACITLREFAPFESEIQAKKNIVQMIKAVAARLGNTPSVCRKCYVHPAVLEYYLSGTMTRIVKVHKQRKASDTLRQEEAALTRLLRHSLKAS
jgi:DNA topoisomerase I